MDTVLRRYLRSPYYTMIKQIICLIFFTFIIRLYHHLVIRITRNKRIDAGKRTLRIFIHGKI